MRKVTIAEISAHTGLSRGTVSRAMNNRREISAATRARVLQACAELNYVPSQTARSLATGRHYSVLVLVEQLGTHAVGGFLRGVLRRAEAEHYSVTVAELSANDTSRSRLELLAYERCDALLFATPVQPDWLPVLAALERRILVLPAAEAALPCDLCAPDLAAAGRLAAQLLNRAAGPARFVGDLRQPATDALRSGFEAALRAAGALPGPALDTAGRPLHEIMTEIMTDDSRKAEFTDARGLLFESDALATEFLLLCPRLGRSPGRDIAVIGCGDEPRSARLSPALTSLDLRPEETGFRAMSLALERLGGAAPETQQAIFIEPRLRLRDTTAQLADPDEPVPAGAAPGETAEILWTASRSPL